MDMGNKKIAEEGFNARGTSDLAYRREHLHW